MFRFELAAGLAAELMVGLMVGLVVPGIDEPDE